MRHRQSGATLRDDVAQAHAGGTRGKRQCSDGRAGEEGAAGIKKRRDEAERLALSTMLSTISKAMGALVALMTFMAADISSGPMLQTGTVRRRGRADQVHG